MASIGSTIADAAAMGPRYARRLVDGIPVERFARFAAPAGEKVVANHPAFIMGHLCLYPIKVLELLGGAVSQVTPPTNYETLFSKNATCQDDVSGTLYPPAKEILDFFNQSYDVAFQALRDASDEQLSAPNPVDTPMREFVPTLGGLLAFYVTGHLMTHLGQLSTWRRMEKLPPA